MLLGVFRENEFQCACVRLEGGDEEEGGFIGALQKLPHVHRSGDLGEVVLAALFAGFERDGLPFFTFTPLARTLISIVKSIPNGSNSSRWIAES